MESRAKKEEQELLVVLGKILIFEFYNGNGPAPKKVGDLIGSISKKIDIPEDQIKKAYIYAREESEKMAFVLKKRERLGFKTSDE